MVGRGLFLTSEVPLQADGRVCGDRAGHLSPRSRHLTPRAMLDCTPQLARRYPIKLCVHGGCVGTHKRLSSLLQPVVRRSGKSTGSYFSPRRVARGNLDCSHEREIFSAGGVYPINRWPTCAPFCFHLAANKDTHRPQGGPLLLEIALL